MPIRDEDFDAIDQVLRVEGMHNQRLYGHVGERFQCFYWCNGWRHWSLGIHLYLHSVFNVEIHLPGGFIRIGLQSQDMRDLIRLSRSVRERYPYLIPWPCPYDRLFYRRPKLRRHKGSI